MARALHDGLCTRQLYVGTKTFGECEVLAADQQESKLRLAQLFVELCVPTSSDIDLVDIVRFRADAVIEGVTFGPRSERQCHVLCHVRANVRLKRRSRLPGSYHARVERFDVGVTIQ